MKKKILVLTLAVLIICTMAIPASAATYTWSDNYDGNSIEISERCTTLEFESSFISSSMDTLMITARVYGWTAQINSDGTSDIIDAGNDVYIDLKSTPGITGTSIARVEPDASIHKVDFTYTIGGNRVYQHTLFATAT